MEFPTIEIRDSVKQQTLYSLKTSCIILLLNKELHKHTEYHFIIYKASDFKNYKSKIQVVEYRHCNECYRRMSTLQKPSDLHYNRTSR